MVLICLFLVGLEGMVAKGAGPGRGSAQLCLDRGHPDPAHSVLPAHSGPQPEQHSEALPASSLMACFAAPNC